MLETPTASRVREHRLRLLLSQAELARRAGIQVATLSAIESGSRRPRFVTLRRLSKALRVPMTELVDRPVPGVLITPAA
jgi:transcriptional regulator with XRE-family HTH domain